MTAFKVVLEYNNTQIIEEVKARNEGEARMVAKLKHPSHRIIRSEKNEEVHS